MRFLLPFSGIHNEFLHKYKAGSAKVAAAVAAAAIRHLFVAVAVVNSQPFILLNEICEKSNAERSMWGACWSTAALASVRGHLEALANPLAATQARAINANVSVTWRA